MIPAFSLLLYPTYGTLRVLGIIERKLRNLPYNLQITPKGTLRIVDCSKREVPRLVPIFPSVYMVYLVV